MAHSGILIANLGSPDSFRVSDVKKYLRQFLMDERIIDVPYLVRKMIVEGFVLPFRPKKSAEAYESIWTDQGSPLLVNTKNFVEILREHINMPVTYCMRYGNPGAGEAVQKLLSENPELKKLFVIPMYPHYAMSSYESAVKDIIDRVGEIDQGIGFGILPPYYDEQGYITALAGSIKPYLNVPYDHLLFSYHGIPERHLKKTDPTHSFCLKEDFSCCNESSELHKYCYRHQVLETMRKTVGQLNIPEDKYSFSFQSRLGKNWLKPYTDLVLKELPGRGIKNLLVVCPAFTADCLETIEEIAIRGKETFIEAGGVNFTMIPCLNTDETWVKQVAGWCHDEKRFLKPEEVLSYEYKN